jgi:hypothetical protein
MVSVRDFDRFVYIVGAPRCGTTTLAQFLKDHPAVGFPAVKEPHFFSQNDLRGHSAQPLRNRVETDYLRRFYRREPGRRVGADASVTYFYAPEQLEPILRLWPNSRFVVALRNPLTMLPSLHQRLIYTGDETIPNFADAWAAVADRAAGRRIPRLCADPRWLRYDQAGRFATYLERLFAVVGRERCHVLLFDDLAADPRRQYQDLMDFLDLETQPITDVTPRRSSKRVRLRWLQRALKRPPASVREYLAGEQFRRRIRALDEESVRRAPNALLALRKRLLAWNRIDLPPEPLSPDLRKQVCQHHEGEIERLGTLLGRELSHWLRCLETSLDEIEVANEAPSNVRRMAAFSQ